MEVHIDKEYVCGKIRNKGQYALAQMIPPLLILISTKTNLYLVTLQEQDERVSRGCKSTGCMCNFLIKENNGRKMLTPYFCNILVFNVL